MVYEALQICARSPKKGLKTPKLGPSQGAEKAKGYQCLQVISNASVCLSVGMYDWALPLGAFGPI